MMNAAITDDDWLVIRQQEDAEDGEIVAAMLDGRAMVKTFKRTTRPTYRSSATRPPSSAASSPSYAASDRK